MRPKCRFGAWKHIQSGLGIKAREQDFDEWLNAWQQARLDIVLINLKDRLKINGFMAGLEVGKTYAASTIVIDYNGQDQVKELPGFTVVKKGKGIDLDFGTGKNELAEFVCAFHKDYIRDTTITSDPFAMWWNSLRAAVMLFWGYSWKWTFAGDDFLVLEKGFELED